MNWQVEWRPVAYQPYTGMFSGSSRGWVRLALASEPSPHQLLTRPGLGLKLLRDGRDSANLVAMFSVDGQQSWNFFKNNFTTHYIPSGDPVLIHLAVKFSEATNFIFQVNPSWIHLTRCSKKIC